MVLRDPNEYAGAVAAELHAVPHARVAICLASSEELALGLARRPLDAIREAEGLAPDPDASALRDSPWLTTFPAGLDEGHMPDTHRFHDPAWDEEPKELPDWWPGRGDQPLVYVTFGSVAGQFPQALPAYGVALSAVAGLPVRVLLTVGRDLDLGALPDTPGNVHVEPWVPQQDVLAHASAAVVHGGSGSTLGALAFGVPLVVIPLFADQPYNARRVHEVGAGIAVEPDREDIPATIAPLRAAIEAVLVGAVVRRRSGGTGRRGPRRTTRRRSGAPVRTPPSALSSSVWPSIRHRASLSRSPGRSGCSRTIRASPRSSSTFAFNEDLNEAVKELPGRWFDWRRKHWRVPARPRVAKSVEELLAQFPDLVPSPDVLAWLSDSDRWRAVCTVVARDGRGHFLVRTLQGDRPDELDRGTDAGDGRTLLPVQRRERHAR